MTLKEVAARCGVSTATVSRVLNDTGRVKEATRARVLRAMSKLNYHPNIHARTLAHGKSRTLGMIVSNLRNPFFLDIFQVLEADAHERGFEVLVANTDYESKQLLTQVRLMRGRSVAGLAVIVSEMEPTLMKELSEDPMPVVFYDVGVPSATSASIRTDYARGTRRAVEYLYSLGHRRMAFVGHHSALEPLNDRRRSFEAAIAECCADARCTTVVDRDSPAGGEQATRRLLATGFGPTALICVNDFMALGAMKALRDAGLAVPRDVSVVGYDNISLSGFACPPLSTLDVPRERIGHLLGEALMTAGGTPSPLWGREILIEPELIIRDSTAPPAGR